MGLLLPLIEQLTGEFDRVGILYCHWKSNQALDRSAAGQNDLDLLVSRPQASSARNVLHDLGFVEGWQHPSRRLPGVIDYYGHASGSDRPVHVHLHVKLVIGDDMTKNYHLPLEEPLLAARRRSEPFWVAAPDFELCLFVLRMVLKHCTWDAVLTGQGRLTTTEQRELQFLAEQVREQDLSKIVEDHLPWVGHELFFKCRRAINQTGPSFQRLLIGQRLGRALTRHQHRSRWLDVPLKTLRRAYWLSRRYLAPRSRRKALANGGLMVAFTSGPEEVRRGLVAALDQWLSRDLAILPIDFSSHRAEPRARRFVAGGGIVLAVNYPGESARRVEVGLPDLMVILDRPGRGAGAIPAAIASVHLDPDEPDLLQSVRQAIWTRL